MSKHGDSVSLHLHSASFHGQGMKLHGHNVSLRVHCVNDDDNNTWDMVSMTRSVSSPSADGSVPPIRFEEMSSSTSPATFEMQLGSVPPNMFLV
jgi:hypothetical protein